MFGFKWRTMLLVDGNILTLSEYQKRPEILTQAVVWAKNNWPESAQYLFIMQISREKIPPPEMFGQYYDKDNYQDQWRPVELLLEGSGLYLELGKHLSDLSVNLGIMTESHTGWVLCLRK